MNFTKLFVGAFSLSAMLVACDSDSASAKDTEIEELSSSSAVEIASTSSSSWQALSSSHRNDSSSSSVMETSSSSVLGIASSSSTIRNDNSSSSSETTQSSSSSENISAGSVYDATAKTLKDLRDGQTYKTVKIGDQWWMAENLNYETDNSFCCNDSAEYCEKYGRLYTWAAAMDSVGTWTTNGKGCGYNKTCSPTYPVRGVCPEGWHLPSTTEFETLFTAVGGVEDEYYTKEWNGAGTVLKSTSGWYNDGNGTDAFGFSALPAGDGYYGGSYDFEGHYAYFWGSTEYGSYRAYGMYLAYGYDDARLGDYSKYYGFSVRCVKD